jgi:3-oxoacyl-[acyl-carrier protein] reductase
MSLSGKVALVTGASRGLGRAIALRLAAEGAAVAVNYRSQQEAAESLAAQIASANGRALAVFADVGERAQVRAMTERVTSEWGSIDVLVNNAGMHRPGDLLDFDYAGMEPMRRVNVDGLVHATQAVAGGMRERGFGRIVNIASIAAHGTRVAGTTFYAATKAAVITLTRRFAMELGAYGITVNAVAPGFIPTEMAVGNRTPAELAAFVEELSKNTMVRRAGRPEDIANAVAFLAATESGFITAQVLTADGGRMDYIGHS